MMFSTLSAWLSWIETIHPVEMDLGLARIRPVAEKLNVLSFACPIIIVGGTNGKGSTVAGLEAIYHAAGYHTGAFTSPFLFTYPEQIRINKKPTYDEALCEAFEKVNAARGGITLTPFEWTTLAALLIFKKEKIDVLLLEVGLGGRLDAVNLLDADVGIITSIGIDHVEWLGETREKIAYEKAGIWRPHQLAICGDPFPPSTLLDEAKRIGVQLFCIDKHFFYEEHHDTTWSWQFDKIHYDALPRNALDSQNMAMVLMAITLLQNKLPVSLQKISQGLQAVHLSGRLQVIPGSILYLYDVAHNPDGVKWLVKKIRSLNIKGKVHAVFSMLADKDMLESLRTIQNEIDDWHTAALPVKRGASEKMLRETFELAEIKNVNIHASISEALDAAEKEASEGDGIIIFGSFHTVSAALTHKARAQKPTS